MIKKTLFLVTLLVSLAVHAGLRDISEASHIIDLERPIKSIDISEVEIHTYKPKKNIIFLGKIHARGMASPDIPGKLDLIGQLSEAISPQIVTEEDDKKLAIKALISEAALIGANIVVITSSYQAQITPEASERRIEALAYTTRTELSETDISCSKSKQCPNSYLCQESICTPYLKSLKYVPKYGSIAEGESCISDDFCKHGLFCSRNELICKIKN